MDKMYILFDLDGTITDPKVGITKSVQFSLQHFGITVADADTLTHFIGPPLRDSYKRCYGFDDEKTEQAVAKYREYFSTHGIYENALYEGMDNLLNTLHARGKQLIVATSKPTVYAKQILQHFNIAQYFAFVAGSELDGRRSKKSEIITYAFAEMGITSPEKAVMIGDREHDVIGANETGLESVGVLYGYGDLQELTDAGATYIAATVVDLHELLCD